MARENENGNLISWKWLGRLLLCVVGVIGWFLYQDVRAAINKLDDRKADKAMFEMMYDDIKHLKADMREHRNHTEGLGMVGK